ncbi:hypothetical protein JXA32_07275 [Candidatus Sumerlaeota bacterium]|nr:hypothetical protein [Candidatus Sumerlaeota bacterium]
MGAVVAVLGDLSGVVAMMINGFTPEQLVKEVEREIEYREWVYSAHGSKRISHQNQRRIDMMKAIADHFNEMAEASGVQGDMLDVS